MIYKIKIKDNKNCRLKYLNSLDNFNNGIEYNFKPGINIIVGNNGCGKSSLMKLLSQYTLSNINYVSEFPNLNITENCFEFNKNFNDDNTFKSGIEVYADYYVVTYNYKIPDDINREHTILDSFENVSLYINLSSMSTGEKTNMTLGTLFNNAFENKNYKFPINDIGTFYEKTTNESLKEKLKSLIEYYNKYKIETKNINNEFTFLLAEPDRNLDIENIDSLYDILSYKKEHVQLIAVIHNPILIYKLSKLDYINFIEMTSNYINKIKNYIENV